MSEYKVINDDDLMFVNGGTGTGDEIQLKYVYYDGVKYYYQVWQKRANDYQVRKWKYNESAGEYKSELTYMNASQILANTFIMYENLPLLLKRKVNSY